METYWQFALQIAYSPIFSDIGYSCMYPLYQGVLYVVCVHTVCSLHVHIRTFIMTASEWVV